MADLHDAIKHAIGEQHDPFAVFDFDNTCIVNDIAEATLAHLCRNKLLRDKTLLPGGGGDYHERIFHRYYALLDKGEIVPAYLLCAQVFSGFTLAEIDVLLSTVIDVEGDEICKTELFGISIAKGLAVRPQVHELLSFLQKENVDIWIISASPEVTVSTAMRRFDIPGKLIGLRNMAVDGVLTSEIHEPYSIADGKVSCIKRYIDKERRPVFGIGDSMNDFSMVEYSNVHAVINRANALTKEAQTRGWFIL